MVSMPQNAPILPQDFYLRPVGEVAPDLLGHLLCRDGIVLMVTEVEAYGGREDTASHCRFGKTARNAPMWRQGGHCYVYLCYGLHWMLNIVTGREGEGAAVLVRSCEVLEGLQEVMERRRTSGVRTKAPGASGVRTKAPDAMCSAGICSGPGKVAQALALDGGHNGHPLYAPGGLELREGTPPTTVAHKKRIGINYAEEKDRNAGLRFVGLW
jgi:DNA-3-methyladenine glycosylase